MTRARDVASVLTAASTLATDVETAAAISSHSSATDPHGDRADTTTQISTHAALTATHGATGAIVGTTNTQTLTNKTLTTPIISSISNSGTLTLPASSDTLVGRATTDTLTNKTLTSPIINTATSTAPILVAPEERTTVSATAAATTVHFDASTQGVLYYTSNATANWTLNVRGTSGNSLSSILAVGDSITVSFLVTNGSTAYYQTAFSIDGSAVTPKYSGGTAPASGNASSIDIYTYTIIKTAATPTYTVFGAGPIKYA
jgi:hypothetical protein